MSTNSESSPQSSRNIAIFSVTALILLALAGYLFYQNAQLRKDIIRLNQDYTNLQDVNVQLDEEFQAAQKQLESLKGDNVELNKLIDEQIGKLEDQKNQIAILVGKSRNMDQARKEIDELKATVEQYVEEINLLKQENSFLTEENKNLKTQSDSLATAYVSSQQQNEVLLSEQEVLTAEAEKLSQENTELNIKVMESSRIQVNNIDVQGFSTKESGREVRRRRAENVEVLNICFEPEVNQLAAEGDEEFFVRILNPRGETISVESAGSGVLTLLKTNTQVPYSTKQTIAYKHREDEICLVWSPEVPFEEGLYAVEIYNKGFPVGNTTFKLR